MLFFFQSDSSSDEDIRHEPVLLGDPRSGLLAELAEVQDQLRALRQEEGDTSRAITAGSERLNLLWCQILQPETDSEYYSSDASVSSDTSDPSSDSSDISFLTDCSSGDTGDDDSSSSPSTDEDDEGNDSRKDGDGRKKKVARRKIHHRVGPLYALMIPAIQMQDITNFTNELNNYHLLVLAARGWQE